MLSPSSSTHTRARWQFLIRALVEREAESGSVERGCVAAVLRV